MKFLALCLLAALVLAGCNKPEATEDDDAKSTAKAATPVATPKPGDWMWKKDDAKKKDEKKDTDPLGIKSNPLDQKPKK
jgi:PBP1b-binding outer membrane lipoprotein LpoB